MERMENYLEELLEVLELGDLVVVLPGVVVVQLCVELQSEQLERQVRTGIRTRVVPRIDRRSLGDSLVSRTSIPWIRSRNIDVTVVRMKPRTTFFAFFDGQKIGDYMIPKVIEVIKDPSTDSRTNSTPFVVGETVEVKLLVQDLRLLHLMISISLILMMILNCPHHILLRPTY